jgi:hypothetical protein
MQLLWINNYMPINPDVNQNKQTMEYGSYVKIVDDARFPPVSANHFGTPYDHYALLTRNVDSMPGLTIPTTQGDQQGFVQKYGFNEDLDSVTNGHEQTIWSVGGPYPWSVLDEPTQLFVSSSSDDDVNIVVQVTGLDQNWEQVTHDVTLQGATPVQLTGEWRRVYRAMVTSDTSTIGDVLIFDGDTVTVAEIMPEEQQTLMALYTVPKGFTGYITCFESTVSRNEDMLFRLRIRERGGVFKTQHIAQVYESPYRYNYDVYKPVLEMSDIECTGSPTNNNVSAHAAFDMILIKNTV